MPMAHARMKQMGADEKIDQLYQISLDEFTAARNALAKESGDGAIKKLEKPNLAAWAGVENLEERVEGDDAIDPVVLERLREAT